VRCDAKRLLVEAALRGRGRLSTKGIWVWWAMLNDIKDCAL
jgi:hypothetical protein